MVEPSDFFEKRVVRAGFLSPLKGFEPELQEIEYRRDPLTGKWCRVNVQRSRRVRQGSSELELDELSKRSREGCFFCPERLELSTPRFSRELIEEGRLRAGETRVFPNLYPFARHHAVATISERHFLRTGEFEREQIENTLLASLEFFRRVHEKDRAARHPTFSWNHLFPSGASILHPHAQLTLDVRPTYMAGRLLEASELYLRSAGRSFWDELLEREKELGERYIGRSGSVDFLASFSPFGNREVLILLRGRSSLLELDEGSVRELAEGVERLLKGYGGMGVESFNLTTYSAPFGAVAPGYCLHLRLVSRPQPLRYYTSDVGFMEGLHFERVVETLPEDVASAMRKLF